MGQTEIRMKFTCGTCKGSGEVAGEPCGDCPESKGYYERWVPLEEALELLNQLEDSQKCS
jgi:DnaJ-class molecular chaperone